MKITPTKELILVRKLEDHPLFNQKTPGGIILPQPRNTNLSVGEVMEGGYQAFDKPKQFIVFPKHAGNQIVLDDGHYILLKPSEILGAIE